MTLYAYPPGVDFFLEIWTLDQAGEAYAWERTLDSDYQEILTADAALTLARRYQRRGYRVRTIKHVSTCEVVDTLEPTSDHPQ